MARQQHDQRRKAERQAIQREERRDRQHVRKRFRRWLYLGISGVIAFLVIVSFILPGVTTGPSRGTGATSYVEGVGVPQGIMPTAFHNNGVTIEYSTTPATSGDHWAAPAQCGFYEGELADEQVVHNMEHGNVIMSHNLIDPLDVARLKNVHDSLSGSGDWLVTRAYTNIPEGQIAITAWGISAEFPGIDEDRIESFFDAYKGNRFSDETRSIGRGIPCTIPQGMDQ